MDRETNVVAARRGHFAFTAIAIGLLVGLALSVAATPAQGKNGKRIEVQPAYEIGVPNTTFVLVAHLYDENGEPLEGHGTSAHVRFYFLPGSPNDPTPGGHGPDMECDTGLDGACSVSYLATEIGTDTICAVLSGPWQACDDPQASDNVDVARRVISPSALPTTAAPPSDETAAPSGPTSTPSGSAAPTDEVTETPEPTPSVTPSAPEETNAPSTGPSSPTPEASAAPSASPIPEPSPVASASATPERTPTVTPTAKPGPSNPRTTPPGPTPTAGAVNPSASPTSAPQEPVPPSPAPAATASEASPFYPVPTEPGSPADSPSARAAQPVTPSNRPTMGVIAAAGKVDTGSGPGYGSVAIPGGQTMPGDPFESVLAQLSDGVARALPPAAEVATGFGFPLILMLIVIGFLLVQPLVDRRDPRLTRAPRSHRDSTMVFIEEDEI